MLEKDGVEFFEKKKVDKPKQNKQKKKSFYSHSKLDTFEKCPLKFKFRYIDKIKPEIEKTIEAHLGSVVHDTLEWLYKEVKKEKVPSLDEAVEHYLQKWSKDYSKDIAITKENMNEEDYKNKGVQFILNYYTMHQPFKDGTLELEKKVIIQLNDEETEEEYKLIGFIDRLAKNPETGEIEIHDYKTANSLPDKEKFETDRQLALYAIAVKEEFSEEQDKEICLVWHYLAHSKKIQSKRTDNQLEQLKKDIIQLIKKVESAEEFPAKPSILCNWCEFKSHCEKHQKNNMKTPQQNSEEKMSISRLAEKRVSETQKSLDVDNYPTIKKYLKF